MKRFLLPLAWVLLLFISSKDYLHAGHDHIFNHGQHEEAGSILLSSNVCFACAVVLTTGDISQSPAVAPPVCCLASSPVEIATAFSPVPVCTALLRGPPAV